LLVPWIVLATAVDLPAQTWQWNTGAGVNGNWSDSSKWAQGTTPVGGNSTILDFSGNITSSFTATNDLGDGFHVFALRFNVENPTRFATIAGNSLYFEGPPGFNGQSVIEQNGTAVARIQSNLAIGGAGMTIQGVGEGIVWIEGAVEGSGILKINSDSSLLILRGGTSGAGLGYLASRSGLTQLVNNENYQFGYLGAGDAGTVGGSMEILSQAKVTNSGQLVVGNIPSAGGHLSVIGTGSLLQQNGAVFVGNSGNGSIFVGSSAVANFNQLVQVGVQADSEGYISGRDQAILNFTDSVHLGVGINSRGTVTLEESATMVVATKPGAGFTVGWAGEGNLDVLDGSSLTVGDSVNSSPLENELVVGREATGEGRVSVRSASLIATNALFGNSGDGRLAVTANATVDVQDTLFLGYNSGSYGEVLVNSYSTLGAQDVQIGRQGIGSFSVLDGGAVTVAGTTFVAPLENASGLLFVAGIDSTYRTGNLIVGGLTSGLPAQGGEGRIEVLTNGSLVVDSELVLYDQGKIVVNSLGRVSVGTMGAVQGAVNVNSGGKLAGTGRVEGNVIVNDQGILTPGLNGVGRLTIDGDLTVAATSQAAVFGWDLANAGAASIDAGGSSASAVHDQLIIEGGSVTLNNMAIVLSELDGFAASFDATQSYSWKLMEIQGTGSLMTLGPFSILFDGSSLIKNAIDNQWGTLSLAVGNQVGSDRFLALSYSAVPEPSALSLVLFGVIGCGLRRSRQV
jgi:T5SS/PEP-CTERM-associated repeat protein